MGIPSRVDSGYIPAPLHIWKLPSTVILRESLSGLRAVFLKAFYTATDAEDVTAADKMR